MRDLTLTDAQRAEVSKYIHLYATDPEYRMGLGGRRVTRDVLLGLAGAFKADLAHPPSLLDVGAGRGETLEMATHAGFDPVRGVECVPLLLDHRIDYGVAWDLPAADDAFDVVTCIDVLEHIRREDIEASLAEMARVARRKVFIGVANHDSRREGVQLHVTRLPYEEWTEIVSGVFPCVQKCTAAHRSANQWFLCVPAGAPS